MAVIFHHNREGYGGNRYWKKVLVFSENLQVKLFQQFVVSAGFCTSRTLSQLCAKEHENNE